LWVSQAFSRSFGIMVETLCLLVNSHLVVLVGSNGVEYCLFELECLCFTSCSVLTHLDNGKVWNVLVQRIQNNLGGKQSQSVTRLSPRQVSLE
jgi:hypothetical protein